MNIQKEGGEKAGTKLGIILSAFIVIGAATSYLGATSRSDLNTHITTLDAKATLVATDVQRLLVDSNLIRGPLIVGGIQSTTAGSTIDWPVSYVSSTYSVSALQFDLEAPSSFSVVSVTAGPASLAANKSVVFSSTTSRGLIFGLNQTILGSGVIAVVRFKLGPMPKSLYPISLVNPVASDANGNTVIMSATSGTVEVH